MSTPHSLPDTPPEGGNNPQAPGNAIAWALHLCQLNRDAEAIAVLQQGLGQHPGNRKMTLLLARCLRNEGQYQSAHDLLAPLLAQAPDDIDLLKLWATVLQTQGRLPQALAALQQVLQLLNERPFTTPSVTPEPARVDPDQDLALLWETLGQLASAGVHAFATAGTLLGLVREKRLLSNDKDFDIGLPWPEVPTAMACLQQHGWRELQCSNGLNNPRAFIHPTSGLGLDLCAFAEDSHTGGCVGGFWMSGIPPHWNRLTDYPALRLQLHNGPSGRHWSLQDPSAWLTALYGPNWQIPDTHFDSSISAHNLRGFSELNQCYALLRIADAWHSGQLPKALRATRAALSHQPNNSLLRTVEETLSRNTAEASD